MARPKKKNADYFSHDADMRNDPKIKALRRKFGLKGYAIWSMFLEILTDSDDFEYEWNELNIELLSGDFDIEPKYLKEVINYCTLTLKLLKMDGQIIYSEKLKERFEGLLSKRNRDVNRYQSEISPTKTENKIVSADGNTQSKVKESKVNETKENKERIKEKAKRFSAPSKIDVYEFMLEKELPDRIATLESDKFWSFYDSKNWYVGKNKMTKWKSAVTGWINRMNDFNNSSNGKSKITEPRINRQTADTIRQNSEGWEIN